MSRNRRAVRPADPLACPGGCGFRRRASLPLCRGCWRRLPGKLRSELFYTHKIAYAQLSNDRAWSAYLTAKSLSVFHLRRNP